MNSITKLISKKKFSLINLFSIVLICCISLSFTKEAWGGKELEDQQKKSLLFQVSKNLSNYSDRSLSRGLIVKIDKATTEQDIYHAIMRNENDFNISVVNILIKKIPSIAKELFALAKEKKVANTHTYDVFIHTMQKIGDFAAIENALQDPTNVGLQDEATHRIFIDVYVKTGRLDKARKMFFESKEFADFIKNKDLHGFNYGMAYLGCEYLIQNAKNGESITLIVGKGKHSKNGVSVVHQGVRDCIVKNFKVDNNFEKEFAREVKNGRIRFQINRDDKSGSSSSASSSEIIPNILLNIIPTSSAASEGVMASSGDNDEGDDSGDNNQDIISGSSSSSSSSSEALFPKSFNPAGNPLGFNDPLRFLNLNREEMKSSGSSDGFSFRRSQGAASFVHIPKEKHGHKRNNSAGKPQHNNFASTNSERERRKEQRFRSYLSRKAKDSQHSSSSSSTTTVVTAPPEPAVILTPLVSTSGAASTTTTTTTVERCANTKGCNLRTNKKLLHWLDRETHNTAGASNISDESKDSKGEDQYRRLDSYFNEIIKDKDVNYDKDDKVFNVINYLIREAIDRNDFHNIVEIFNLSVRQGSDNRNIISKFLYYAKEKGRIEEARVVFNSWIQGVCALICEDGYHSERLYATLNIVHTYISILDNYEQIKIIFLMANIFNLVWQEECAVTKMFLLKAIKANKGTPATKLIKEIPDTYQGAVQKILSSCSSESFSNLFSNFSNSPASIISSSSSSSSSGNAKSNASLESQVNDIGRPRAVESKVSSALSDKEFRQRCHGSLAVMQQEVDRLLHFAPMSGSSSNPESSSSSSASASDNAKSNASLESQVNDIGRPEDVESKFNGALGEREFRRLYSNSLAVMQQGVNVLSSYLTSSSKSSSSSNPESSSSSSSSASGNVKSNASLESQINDIGKPDAVESKVGGTLDKKTEFQERDNSLVVAQQQINRLRSLLSRQIDPEVSEEINKIIESLNEAKLTKEQQEEFNEIKEILTVNAKLKPLDDYSNPAIEFDTTTSILDAKLLPKGIIKDRFIYPSGIGFAGVGFSVGS